MAEGHRQLKEIGGYPDFDFPRLPAGLRDSRFDAALHLNCGRNALACILRTMLRNGRILPSSRVFMAAYTCSAVSRAVNDCGLQIRFYPIAPHTMLPLPGESPSPADVIILTNYLGIYDSALLAYARQSLAAVVIDNTQALFMPPAHDIPAFYSPRKFIGLPDGGFATGIPPCDIPPALPHDPAYEYHLRLRPLVGAEAGYPCYLRNEARISGLPTAGISSRSLELIGQCDCEAIIARRRENFDILHTLLGDSNIFTVPDCDNFTAPLAYPYLPSVAVEPDLHSRLLKHRIYVPRYWPQTAAPLRPDDYGHTLCRHMLPLPVDHRANPADMTRIAWLITKTIREALLTHG